MPQPLEPDCIDYRAIELAHEMNMPLAHLASFWWLDDLVGQEDVDGQPYAFDDIWF